MRQDILAFGTGNICKELLTRTVPMKLNPDDPATGRLFPSRCTTRELPNGDLYVEFTGTGYAWSNLTKRVGFNASAAITYELDFRLDGSTAYVYFRPATATSKAFQMLMVEQDALPSSAIAPLLPGGTPEAFVAMAGDGLLTHELGEGFTVIRESDGTATFAIGTLEPGEAPIGAYERTSGANTVYTNERVEIHQNQREYFGPITVEDDDQAILLTMLVEGAPQVDVQVYPRASVETWLAQYISQKAAPPAPAVPMLDDTIVASVDGKATRRAVRAPRGQYFVVIDHTVNAGRTAPPATPGDDRAALVLVGIEVGDAP
ncbi:MAG: hypothetical protein HOW73_13260 [Polyangiaceae bacterium]|nr:hypothetical protein [Polyangiaceae bacterium]